MLCVKSAKDIVGVTSFVTSNTYFDSLNDAFLSTNKGTPILIFCHPKDFNMLS